MPDPLSVVCPYCAAKAGDYCLPRGVNSKRLRDNGNTMIHKKRVSAARVSSLPPVPELTARAVPCPLCKAVVGKPCRGRRAGFSEQKYFHASRKVAFGNFKRRQQS